MNRLDNTERVRLLINAGANVNHIDAINMTAIEWAVRNGNLYKYTFVS